MHISEMENMMHQCVSFEHDVPIVFVNMCMIRFIKNDSIKSNNGIKPPGSANGGCIKH